VAGRPGPLRIAQPTAYFLPTWKLLGLVNGDGKDVGYWLNLVLKPGMKLQECIKENVFDVPELFSFELLDLLAAWKQILIVEIDHWPSIVTRRFEIEGKTVEFNII
jgi:hypothetical protein